EDGYLKTYTIVSSLDEILAAISTGENLFAESSAYLGNSRMDLSYFGARYLDNDLGIWLSADPMNQYWNSYSYCGANPINLIDLWGLESDEEEARRRAEEARLKAERDEYERRLQEAQEVTRYTFGEDEINAERIRLMQEQIRELQDNYHYDMVMNDIGERQKDKNNYYRLNYAANAVSENNANGAIYNGIKIGSGVASLIPLSEIGSHIANVNRTMTYYSYVANKSGVVFEETYFLADDLLKGLSISKALKIGGYTAFGISAGFSVYEGYQSARSGNYLGVQKAGFDFGMSYAAFYWPVGTIVSAGYFGLDLLGVWNFEPPYNGPSSPFDVPEATRVTW
ncbi:MAG: hypothetical protein JXB49_34755, partial [Bacteroidales bacterium]|nr:hypothetical protein [Bacteroidales bacterium]